MSVTASGGWCAPTEHLAVSIEPAEDGLPQVVVRRGGMRFTAPDFTPPTEEEVAAWRAEQERQRAERKAAGGEWRYAYREPDGTIWDGSSSWDEGERYLSVEALRESEGYLAEDDWEIVRRWIPDPPDWEVFDGQA